VFFINGAGIGQHISQLLRFLNDYCFGSIKDIRRLDVHQWLSHPPVMILISNLMILRFVTLLP